MADNDSALASHGRSSGYVIRRTFKSVSHALEQHLQEFGLSTTMWFLLRILWEQDGQTQRELSDELVLGQSATVSLVDSLEKRGLIERRRNTDDRRKSNIFLTAEGRKLQERVTPVVSKVNARIEGGLTRREVAELWRLLDLVVASLEEEKG